MRPRFKLRTLLIAVTVCACALGGWRFYTEPYRQARIAIQELGELHAFVDTKPVEFPRWAQWLPWTRDCDKITGVTNYWTGEIAPAAPPSTDELRPKNLVMGHRKYPITPNKNYGRWFERGRMP